MQINNIVINAYFFRKTCVTVEIGMEVLSCFASIHDDDNEELFVEGFKNCFWTIAETHRFGFAAIENISNNDIILRNLSTKPYIVSPTAYFFYNFACNTIPANKCLILL